MKKLIVLLCLFIVVSSVVAGRRRKSAIIRRSNSKYVPVALIAPFVKDARSGRLAIKVFKFQEVALKYASYILVAIHSDSNSPLMWSYDSIKGLKNAASLWSRYSSDQCHIMLYTINSDLSVNQIKHFKYTIPKKNTQYQNNIQQKTYRKYPSYSKPKPKKPGFTFY